MKDYEIMRQTALDCMKPDTAADGLNEEIEETAGVVKSQACDNAAHVRNTIGKYETGGPL